MDPVIFELNRIQNLVDMNLAGTWGWLRGDLSRSGAFGLQHTGTIPGFGTGTSSYGWNPAFAPALGSASSWNSGLFGGFVPGFGGLSHTSLETGGIAPGFFGSSFTGVPVGAFRTGFAPFLGFDSGFVPGAEKGFGGIEHSAYVGTPVMTTQGYGYATPTGTGYGDQIVRFGRDLLRRRYELWLKEDSARLDTMVIGSQAVGLVHSLLGASQFGGMNPYVQQIRSAGQLAVNRARELRGLGDSFRQQVFALDRQFDAIYQGSWQALQGVGLHPSLAQAFAYDEGCARRIGELRRTEESIRASRIQFEDGRLGFVHNTLSDPSALTRNVGLNPWIDTLRADETSTLRRAIELKRSEDSVRMEIYRIQFERANLWESVIRSVPAHLQGMLSGLFGQLGIGQTTPEFGIQARETGFAGYGRGLPTAGLAYGLGGFGAGYPVEGVFGGGYLPSTHGVGNVAAFGWSMPYGWQGFGGGMMGYGQLPMAVGGYPMGLGQFPAGFGLGQGWTGGFGGQGPVVNGGTPTGVNPGAGLSTGSVNVGTTSPNPAV